MSVTLYFIDLLIFDSARRMALSRSRRSPLAVADLELEMGPSVELIDKLGFCDTGCVGGAVTVQKNDNATAASSIWNRSECLKIEHLNLLRTEHF